MILDYFIIVMNSIACRKFRVVKILLSKSLFNNDIIKVILTHYWNIIDGKNKKLLSWIELDKLSWFGLSRNPNAIQLLRNNIDKIYWSELSLNEMAICLLRENYSKIDWNNLSMNTGAIDLLRDNQDKINWYNLSMNRNAIDLLRENVDKISWLLICYNPNAKALIAEHFNKLSNNSLSIFSETLKQVKLSKELESYDKSILYNKYKHLTVWYDLCNLSNNKDAMELLRDNLDKIDWYILSKNPAIFTDELMPDNI